MKRSLYIALSASAALAASLGTAAHAETIVVEGYLPAASDIGLELEVIAVEPLGGRQGSKVGFEIKQALERAQIDGEAWFDIAPGMDTPVDAVIQGSAGSQSSITQLEDKAVRSCAEEDADDKCIRYKTTFYDCNQFDVSLYPDIEIIGRDGEVLYSERDEMSSSITHCDDDGARPSRSEMTDRLVSSFAGRLRRALAPRNYGREYRILERRKGQEKAERKAFKQAVKLTKTDEDAACAAFKDIETRAPQQPSVLYNVALCYERYQEYELARAAYQRALDAAPNKPMTLEAFDRVDDWARGRDQVARRAELLAARYAAPEPAVAAADGVQVQETRDALTE